MVFPTITFAIFFAIVLPASWALMRRQGAWKGFVLAASYVFYATADWRFAFMLAGITVGNHVFAKAIHASQDDRRRKLLVTTAVVLDLLTLGVFKYYGFFVEQAAGALDTVGLGAPFPVLAIALPIGISFITFHAISYVVDVHRRQLEPPALVDLGDLHQLLPAPRRRPDRARVGVPARSCVSRATPARSPSARRRS